MILREVSGSGSLSPLVQRERQKGVKNCQDKDCKKLYLRVESVNTPKAKEALSILKLSKGNTAVLFYETSTKKYIAPRGVSVSAADMLIGALRALLGQDNVIYQ